jgi:1-acyl-sn-glycerol-3-phosphate acyltransferase
MRYPLNFVKYIIRTVNFLVFTGIILLISFLPQALISGFFPKLYQWWSYAFFCWFGLEEHIHVKYTLPLPQQYILISNHYTGLDVVWLPGKFYVKPLSKDALRKWPLIGGIIKKAGVLFVNRESKRSRGAAMGNMLKALEAGNNLLLFPEGGCFGRFLHPFKDGAFSLSLLSGVPILPIYLHYENEDVYEMLDNEGIQYVIDIMFKPRNRRAHLYIFDPIFPQQFDNAMAYKDHVFELYKQAEAKYKKLRLAFIAVL